MNPIAGRPHILVLTVTCPGGEIVYHWDLVCPNTSVRPRPCAIVDLVTEEYNDEECWGESWMEMIDFPDDVRIEGLTGNGPWPVDIIYDEGLTIVARTPNDPPRT